ncbi:hypothetical protein GBA52_004138 [Prunus armeniaca]|nr:hypothetical protein GBA52_004138 [Prunus armeniaca]
MAMIVRPSSSQPPLILPLPPNLTDPVPTSPPPIKPNRHQHQHHHHANGIKTKHPIEPNTHLAT